MPNVRTLALALSFVFSLQSVAAAQSQQQEWSPRLVHAAIAASIVAHACDLATSSWAMGRGGDQFHEANPALRWASHGPVKYAITKMSIATGFSYGVLQLHKSHPKWALTYAIAQTVVVGYVAHHNSRLLTQR